jgi:mono/diheme cytochrome c family protein
MSFSHRFVWLFLGAFAIVSPIALAAQESAPATPQKRIALRPVLNEQQKKGEALFVQNCPLCHVSSNQKKRLGIQGPVLQGLFTEETDEDTLRQVIQQGIPEKMPGFRYALEPKQIDDLIAFLKAGAYLRTPGAGN